jgi:hypothetical protein
MPDPTQSLELLRLKRDHLLTEFAHLGDLRPGSLVERYRPCGKPSCHCAAKGARGHGPSYSLTRALKGKTTTHIIPPGPAVEQTRQQIAEYRRFRDLVRHLIEVSEQVCDLQLRLSQSAPQAEDKKNSTRRVPRRRDRPRG